MFMKIFFFILVGLSFISLSAQEKNDWIIGLGVNVIDNTNSKDDNYFNVSNWNAVTSISKLSAQYFVKSNLSVSSEFTLNMLHKNNMQNGVYLDTNAAYFGLDFNIRYNTVNWLGLSDKFQVEPLAGFGFSWAGTIPNNSVNTGLSLGYFINDSYGIRIQTLGKFTLDESKVGNNMIQHSLELIIKL